MSFKLDVSINQMGADTLKKLFEVIEANRCKTISIANVLSEEKHICYLISFSNSLDLLF